MAWSIVGVGAVVETATTTHTLTEPAGCAAGDLLIACFSFRSTATGNLTPPAGWTVVRQNYANNVLTTTSAGASTWVGWTIRGASAPALTWTHQSGINVALGRIVAYRGNDQSGTPTDGADLSNTGTNVTAVSIAAQITTTLANDLLVGVMCGGQEAAWSAFKTANAPSTASGTTDTTTAPSTTTWIERADTNTLNGAQCSLAIFDAVKATAGATGTTTCTASLGAIQTRTLIGFKILQPNVTVNATGQSMTASVGSVGSNGAIGTTLNPFDKKSAQVFLSNGNLTVTGGDSGGNNWVRSTDSKTGKRYVEVTINTVFNTVFGIADASAITYPGANASSFGLYYNGFGSLNGAFPDWGGGAGTPYNTYTTGDVMGMAFDPTAKKVWFRKNGGVWNGSALNDPVTGTGGLDVSAYTGTTHFFIVSGDSGHITTVNFGLTPFATAPPSGFSQWGNPISVTVNATGQSVAASVGSVMATGSFPIWQSEAHFTYTAGQTGVTVNKPAGTVDGDILIAHIVEGFSSGPADPSSVPSGWTQIGGYVTTSGGGFFTKDGWWWKRASSEGSSYTWGFAASYSTEALIQRYNNCIASGNPVDAFNTAFGTTGGAPNPGITTTVANTLLVLLTQNWDATGTLNPPSGAWTERFDHLLYSADEQWPTASATGIVDQSLGSNPWISMLLALKPFVPATPNVTVNVTGQSVTASVNNVAASIPQSVSVTGQSVTASVGTVSVTAAVNISTTLTGQSVTASVNSVTATAIQNATVNLTGNPVTASVGGVTVAAGGTVSITAAGQAVTASVGTVTVTAVQNATVNVTGNQATASVGNVSVAGAAVVQASGQQATASVGNVSVTAIKNVTVNLNVTFDVIESYYGFVTVTTTRNVTVNLTGNPVTASVGSASVSAGGSISFGAAGSQATASVGNVSVTAAQNVSTSVSGQSVAASVGNVSVTAVTGVTVNVTGQQVTASVGNESVTAGANVSVAVTSPSMMASVGNATVALITSATVNVTGQDLFINYGFVDVQTVTRVAVTGQQMTILTDGVVGSIPVDVAVSGFTMTASLNSSLGFILTANVYPVTAPMVISLGQALCLNWGMPDEGHREGWTDAAGDSGTAWTPVPRPPAEVWTNANRSGETWTIVPKDTPNEWNH